MPSNRSLECQTSVLAQDCIVENMGVQGLTQPDAYYPTSETPDAKHFLNIYGGLDQSWTVLICLGFSASR